MSRYPPFERTGRAGSQESLQRSRPAAYTPCLAAWHRQLQPAFAAGLAVFRSFFAAGGLPSLRTCDYCHPAD
jgi:hypothetical protein